MSNNFKKILAVFQLIAILLVSNILYSNDILNSEFNISRVPNISQNDINDIYKDSKGFMWIATLDGLVKYDGSGSKTYRIKQGKNSISSNMIIDIDEDRFGNIWIATFGKGVCKLNPVTEKFTSYYKEASDNYKLFSNDIDCIFVDDSIIWLGNKKALTRLTLDKSMSEIINEDIIFIDSLSNSTESASIKKIFKDKEGDIWVGLNSHLIRFSNPYAPTNELIFENKQANINSFCYFDSLFIAGGQFIYVIQKKEGAKFDLIRVRYNQGSGIICNEKHLWAGDTKGIVRIKNKYWNWWEEDEIFTVENTGYALKSNLITCLVNDDFGQIWVGTLGGGVHIINKKNNYFQHYINTSNLNSINNNMIRSAFEDSKQNLWIGTEEGGLNYLINEDRYNYENGFNKIDILNYPEEHNRVYAIDEQLTPNSNRHQRLIWLGTSFPTFLQAINPETMKPLPRNVLTENIGFVFALEVQNDTTLWVGTYGEGLYKFITDINGNIKKRYHYTADDNTDGSISSNIVRHILCDSKKNLWITTDNGLNRIIPEQINDTAPKFITYRLGINEDKPANDYLLQVFESSKGKVWIGSMGSGLIGIDSELSNDSLLFSLTTTENGLPNNSIKAIREDKNGNLWLSSNKGLSKYNPINGDIVNYDIEDGLQDYEFAELVSCSRKNGQLIFGGNSGLNVFYPDTIVKDTTRTKLFFTNFYILNELVEPGMLFNGQNILKNSIEYTSNITLKHNQNSFSIEFTGIQYNSPQKNKYKYMLEGFDEKWNKTTADYRIAKYTNMPAGEYKFMVLGANCDNIWTSNPISLDIKVKPHPLLSNVAYIIYLTVLILIIWVITRTMITISNKKKEALIAGVEKRNAEEISQMKLRFFTNISHEFRTPLTLISIPIEKLIKSKSKLTEQEHKDIGIIKQNTDVMLRLVNQLLDFRKFDQNKMNLELSMANIVAFAENIFNSFESMSIHKSIDYEFNTSDKEIIFPFDTGKVEKIIYNLLSNAFKFTPEYGEIKLNISSDKIGNSIIISVSDTGIGIKESDKNLVFERYYQTNNQKCSDITGTGIGLSLTKGMVELHGGEIILDSKEGKGSIFTVVLPIDSGSVNLANDKEIIVSEKIEKPQFSESTTNANKLIEELKNRENTYKLLVVEDNKELRETIAGIFNQSFEVFQAENGLIGYEACIENEPDVVISDVMMPEMDGIEMLTTIKNDEKVSHIPVILLTAKSSVEDRIEGHLSGADSYISKPFNSNILFANVISVIKNRDSLKTRFQKEIEINPMVISNSPADVMFMEKILSLIEDNLSEPGFNVDKLSEAYGVSRVHLNRKIKALTGETPNQFLRSIKLKHAAEHLKKSSLNVSEVAWEVGFSDIPTFRKRFKEQFGVSPSEYAKRQ